MTALIRMEMYLRWQLEMTISNDCAVWDDSLKMTAWYDNLRWQFKMTIWDDSLRWQFEMTVWNDSLKWQFKMTVWNDSLKWHFSRQFEMSISICKGGLISESFSCWLQSHKKSAKNYPPSKGKMLRIVLGTSLLGDWK